MRTANENVGNHRRFNKTEQPAWSEEKDWREDYGLD